jgi:hypothetical protein
MLRNDAWEKEIRRIAALKTVKLPVEQKKTSKTDPTLLENILIYGDFSRTTIRVSARAMVEDMQKNAAAFEAWALALLVHCKVAEVAVEVGPGVDRTTPAFHRFCARLARFEALYRGVVVVEDRALLAPRPAMAAAAAVETSPARQGAGKLAQSPAFQRTFQLDAPPRRDICLDPFGVDGAGAMVGVRGDTLLMFAARLHDRKSEPRPGLVSQALFDAAQMRETLLGQTLPGAIADSADHPLTAARMAACTQIEVVLLSDRFHPLVAAPGVLDSLNAAAARTWPDLPVRFTRWIVAARPPVEEDFLFVDANAAQASVFSAAVV